MVHYKLTYFNVRGRAEVMRMLFALAEVQYEDVRIEQADWPAKKAEIAPPFGQIPILEVDGVRLCQSNACARYIAKQFKLAGKTDLDQAKADIIVDCCDDGIKPAIAVFSEKDEAKKEDLKKKFREEQLPVSLGYLENLLKSNNGGDGYFVGNELTWADIVFINFISWTESFASAVDPLAKFPKLHALEKRVTDNPKIKEWIAKRPKTSF